MSSISSSSSPSVPHLLSESFIKEEVITQTRKLWPEEELTKLSSERIRHFNEDLQPRLNYLESAINKIGVTIKELANAVFDIKNADAAFFTRVKEMEGRIEKMLEPSEEYQKLQAQSKKDLITIIATISTVAVVILGAIVLAAVLL